MTEFPVNPLRLDPYNNFKFRVKWDGQYIAAVSIFEIVYRRLVPRLGHNKTIGAIAHRICQLIWMILNKGVRYEERGTAVSENSRRVRTSRMIRTLRNLGYRVELQADPA